MFPGPIYTRFLDVPFLPARKDTRVVFGVGLRPDDLPSLGKTPSVVKNVPCLALLDIDPKGLQASLKFLLDRRGHVPIVEVRLFLSLRELQGALSAPAPEASTLPAAESEDGQRTIKAFLAGKTPLPDDSGYIQRGTAARKQERVLAQKLWDKLQLNTAPAVVTVHALLPGMGTTTMLQRVAHILRMSPDTFAAVLPLRNEVGLALAKAAAASNIALLIASPVQRAEEDRKVLREALVARRAKLKVGAVVLQVLVHELGDDISPGEMYLDPLLTEREAKGFVRLYSLFYPKMEDDLWPLAKDETWVGLPGLVVSDGCHGNSHRTLSHLKETLKWGKMYATDKLWFLAELAALELFAAGGSGLPRGVGLCGGDFPKEWRLVLETPAGAQHRLVSIVWAIPLLRNMAGLSILVAPATSSGLELKPLSASALPLSALMREGLMSLVASNVSLLPWLKKSRDFDGRSCLPRWMLLLEDVEGDDSVTKLLLSLVENWPLRHADSSDELKGSFVQASVLLAQQREKKSAWAAGLDALDKAVKAATGSPSDRIARANRGRLVSNAVAAGHGFAGPTLDACVEDFRKVIDDKRTTGAFDPSMLWSGAVSKLRNSAHADGMDSKSPASWLYKKLSDLDDPSAPPTPCPDFAVQVPSRREASKGVGPRRALRRLRTPSPLFDETQGDPTIRLNQVLNRGFLCSTQSELRQCGLLTRADGC